MKRCKGNLDLALNVEGYKATKPSRGSTMLLLGCGILSSMESGILKSFLSLSIVHKVAFDSLLSNWKPLYRNAMIVVVSNLSNNSSSRRNRRGATHGLLVTHLYNPPPPTFTRLIMVSFKRIHGKNKKEGTKKKNLSQARKGKP